MKSRKTVYWIISCAALVIAFLGYGFFTHLFFPINAFGGGDGTSGNPYQVTNCTDFQAINSNLSANYIISNNFSCSGVTSWSAMGQFTGVLDGNDKTISDFTGSNVQGIFVGLSGATIKDLTISNVQFSSPGNEYVGALAGNAGNSTTNNVHITGSSITGYNMVGGLYGNIEGGTITDSSAAASVTGVNFVGGLVGRLVDAPVDGCYATGSVSSTGNPTGGLIGYSTGAISNSYATGNVFENNPSASDQWATGGLVGYASGGITNSYATGDVDSYWEAGGLVGWVENAPISNCYAIGDVGNTIKTGTRIGGFVGAGLADISNSFAMGNVTGSDSVGGFAGGFGWGGHTLSYSYSKGAVSGSTNVGGLVGDLEGTVSSTCYYDSQTSGQSDTGKGTPETTSAMKTQSTYVDWDFSTIWTIDSSVNSGYPVNYTITGVSSNATVTSSTYTVSSGGTSSETITNVPYGTSKADFLSNISKGNANQTWSDTDISDPVFTGDTLVVTAQDTTTVVTYTVTVKAEASHIATVTSSTYTVSAGGTENETIGDVSEGTSKATFLANLTKGNSNQTWSDTNISDPIDFGNTLVVTAEDGTTKVTYTLTPPPFSGNGAGTLANPYQITTCGELQEMRYYLSSNFILNQNIDCSETSTWNSGNGFIPIGASSTKPFVGTLKGNNFTIDGLTIYRPTSGNGGFIGLFGVVDNNATIRDLSLTNVSITASTYTNVGVLIGALGFVSYGAATIDNIHIVSGSVTGNLNVGGIIGMSAYNITYSSSNISVNGTSSVGGLVGEMVGNITSCYATGNVTAGATNAGGLVGTGSGNITNSYATGDVSAYSYGAGGLVGAYVISSTRYAYIERSYATGDVVSDDDAGGFIGQMTSSGTASYSAGLVKDCYSTGNVTESQTYRDGYYIAGFVGELSNGTIENSYSIGVVNSGNPSSYSGGFNGSLSDTVAAISNSFWNTETSGYSTSAGGTGKTTSELKTKTTFTNAGWDFSSVWNISTNVNNGYPFFGSVQGFPGNGSGTIASPYEITSCELLQDMSYDLDAHYILKNNIDCSGTSSWNSGAGFEPVGFDANNPFVGTLSGDGYTISGLTINRSVAGDEYIGLFGILGNESSVINLKLSNVNITSTNGKFVGALAGAFGGDCDNGGPINITGSGSVSNISVLNGSVTGNNRIGGLFGISCYEVSYANSSATITASNGVAGGLVGENCGLIKNSYATGDVLGPDYTGDYGGLVGRSYGSIADSHATGRIHNPNGNTMGGLVGTFITYRNMYTSIVRSYATGDVEGDDMLGGLIGDMVSYVNPGKDTSLVKDCYAVGNVTESSDSPDGFGIGGLMGRFTSGTVENSYAANVVYSGNPSNESGGLVGRLENYGTYGTMINTFWNTQISGFATSSVGTGKTTSEMKTKTTYTNVNWDFDNIWNIGQANNGYPVIGFSGSGNGLVADPYQITNCKQLQDMSYNLGGVYILQNDIDCSETSTWNDGEGFLPIGTDPTSSFTGLLNGNNKAISNLVINKSSSDSGAFISIFGAIDGGEVKDLVVKNINITAVHYVNVGGLVGAMGLAGTTVSTISNVSIESGVVNGYSSVGGLIGFAYGLNDTIENSSTNVKVTGGNAEIGGLIGYDTSSVTNCSAAGEISGVKNVGGLIGGAWDNTDNVSTLISNSHATGAVTSTGDQAGGLIGGIGWDETNTTLNVVNCYATGDVTSSGSRVGGLIGVGYKDVTDSYATGKVTGKDYVGGLIGMNFGNIVDNSHAAGKVVGTGKNIGGLIGVAYTVVTNSYATGNVTGLGEGVGGLIGIAYEGELSDTMENNYALGEVKGSGNQVGGLMGYTALPVSTSYASGNVYSDGANASYIGGLIGFSEAPILNSYATGNVTGGKYVGGLIGFADYEVTNTYSLGRVTASISDVGGLIGYNYDSVTSSYYNLDTAAQGDIGKGTGKTTIQMADPATYVGWDFTHIWILPVFNISADPTAGGVVSATGTHLGYPYFRYQTNEITISETPNSGYTFDQWKDNGTTLSSNQSYTFTNSQILSNPNHTILASYHKTTIIDDIVDIITPIINPPVVEPPVVEPPVVEPPVVEPPVVDPDTDEPDTNTDTTPDTNTNNGITNVIESISTGTKKVVEVLSASISAVSNKSEKIAKDLPVSEEASQNITAATLAIITVTPVVTAGLGSSEAIASIIKVFSSMLVFFKVGKKKRNCGLVYNSLTKEPIRNVVVRFYDSNNELASTEVTNVYGIFETNLPDGNYSILIQGSGYVFPSRVIWGVEDVPYKNIYKGGLFRYDSSVDVSFSIPIDPVDRSLPEYVKAVNKNHLLSLLSVITTVLTIAGFFFSVISYLKNENTLNLVLLIIYAIILLITLLVSKKNLFGFGVVKNELGLLEPNFEIGLMETEFGTLYAKRITNDKGKYRFIVPNGKYRLVSLNPQYDIDVRGNAEVIARGKRVTGISKNIILRKKS